MESARDRLEKQNLLRHTSIFFGKFQLPLARICLIIGGKNYSIIESLSFYHKFKLITALFSITFDEVILKG